MKPVSRLSHAMLALSVLMSMTPAQAGRIKAVAGAVPVAGVPVAQSPGEYSFRQYDETKLQNEILKVLETRSKEDKEYVESSVRLLNMSVNDLINEQIKGGLQQMSDESTAGGSASALDPVKFLAAKRSFEASIEKINAQINGISALPSVMKGGNQLNVDGRVHEIKNRYNIDMSPVINSYTEQVSALVTKMNELSFTVRANNGKIIEQKGLTLNDDFKANRFEPGEIAKMRLQATTLRVLTPREQAALTNFNVFTINNLNAAINSYGQTYRMNMDDSGKKEALKMIEQLFFVRSIMRVQYGVALGTPQLAYDLKKFNWDFFSTENRLTFTQAGVKKQEDQVALHQALATAMVTHEARTKEVFGSDSNVFSKVTSSITYLKGERARAGLNAIMIRLLLADLNEEMKLSQPGGRRELKSMIQARYYSTKANEAYFKSLGRSLTGSGEGGAYADAGEVSTDTVPGMYRLTAPVLANFQTRVTQAMAIEQAIAAMDEPAQKRVKQINKDLFD